MACTIVGGILLPILPLKIKNIEEMLLRTDAQNLHLTPATSRDANYRTCGIL